MVKALTADNCPDYDDLPVKIYYLTNSKIVAYVVCFFINIFGVNNAKV